MTYDSLAVQVHYFSTEELYLGAIISFIMVTVIFYFTYTCRKWLSVRRYDWSNEQSRHWNRLWKFTLVCFTYLDYCTPTKLNQNECDLATVRMTSQFQPPSFLFFVCVGVSCFSRWTKVVYHQPQYLLSPFNSTATTFHEQHYRVCVVRAWLCVGGSLVLWYRSDFC